MILERVEKDGIVKAIYESSNIIASSYDKVKQDLNITFKHGGNYTYQGVGDTDYMRFETAESQGKVLNSNLKKYPFLKHEAVDVDKILKQIEKLNNAEVFAMEDGMINLMRRLVELHDNEGVFDVSGIEKLISMNNTYNELKK